jgi:hypothetical protein
VIIKTLLVAGLLVAAVYTVRGRRTALHTLVRRAFVIGFFASGVIVVLFPSLLTEVANAVGVGRGTDLLLYLLCIAYTFTTIAFYRRFRELEDRYVELARGIALQPHRRDVAVPAGDLDGEHPAP